MRTALSRSFHFTKNVLSCRENSARFPRKLPLARERYRQPNQQ
jgi:hypothetical protein